MKKLFLMFLLALVFMVGCESGGEVLGNKTRKVIKIGAPLSLTGNGACYGIQSRNGIELALGEVNSQEANFEFEIVYEDTQGDPKMAVGAVNKLINIDRTKILLGPTRSAEASVTTAIAEQARVIMFLTAPSTEDITNAGDYIFRNRETARLHGRVMAEFLAGKNKKVALLTAQVSNSITYKNSFKPRFEELGGKIVFSEEYDNEELDFKTLIVRAKESGAEIFYIMGATYQDAALVLRQVRELGFGGLVVGSLAMGGMIFWNWLRIRLKG